MSLVQILIFCLAALLGQLLAPRWRFWFILVCSTLAVYWLQPPTPIRHLDFWLPTTAVGMTLLVWTVTQPRKDHKASIAGGLLIAAAIMGIGAVRYLQPLCCLTPSKPPQALPLIAVLAATALIALVLSRLAAGKRKITSIFAITILGLFIILKSEALASTASALLRRASGQQVELASAIDLPWLGFSYLAFRLLHVLIDHKNGRLPELSLGEFVAYAIFFPAYTAGPIDRSQRFLGDLQRLSQIGKEETTPRAIFQPKPDLEAISSAIWRILWGIFKKFALADSLALIALNSQNASQVAQSGWTWVLLYAYSLRIYMDFSGYTDIAIGLGQILGIKLPENFQKPYLQPNLTAFWNSWHITLAQWMRAYVFNPLTRALRARAKLPTWAIILTGQLATMVLIGLWHGITLNFLLWGAWHGIGLFIHNRWIELVKTRSGLLDRLQARSLATQILGCVLTFHYVALGWVFFVLPDTVQSLAVLQKLVGL